MSSKDAAIITIDPSIAHISTWNTRQPKPDDPRVIALADSIESGRQITAAVGRPHPTKKGEYELAAGARRKVATQSRGLKLRIDVQPMTDDELKDIILVDNLQREDPDAIAESRLIQDRLKDGATISELAATYGISELRIKRRLKLLNLTPNWTKLEDPPLWSDEMLEIFASLPILVQNDQVEKMGQSWGHNWSGLRSVAALQRAIKKHSGKRDASAEFLKLKCTAIKGCSSKGCSAASEADLFAEDPDHSGSHCLNPDCFDQRAELYFRHQVIELLEKNPKAILLNFGETYNHPCRGIEIKHGKKVHTIIEHEPWDGPCHKKTRRKTAKEDGDIVAIDCTEILNPKIVIVTKHARRSYSSSSSSSSDPAKPKIDKTVKLQLRRWKLVQDALRQLVHDATPKNVMPQTHTDYLRFICLFGAEGQDPWSDNDNTKKLKARWDFALDITGPDPTKEQEVIRGEVGYTTWQQVALDMIKPRLEAQLMFGGLESMKPGTYNRIRMDKLADFLKVDINSLKAKVDKELKPPKSWGDVDIHTLKPNGKPAAKKAAKKVSKKAAKKK